MSSVVIVPRAILWPSFGCGIKLKPPRSCTEFSTSGPRCFYKLHRKLFLSSYGLHPGNTPLPSPMNLSLMFSLLGLLSLTP